MEGVFPALLFRREARLPVFVGSPPIFLMCGGKSAFACQATRSKISFNSQHRIPVHKKTAEPGSLRMGKAAIALSLKMEAPPLRSMKLALRSTPS